MCPAQATAPQKTRMVDRAGSNSQARNRVRQNKQTHLLYDKRNKSQARNRKWAAHPHPSQEKAWPFTIYDLRFTIWKVRRAELAGGGARATRNLKAVIGRSYKGAGGGGRRSLPMYEVRGTMYDLESSRALRGDAKLGRTGCPEAVIGRSYKGAGGGE